MKKTITIVVLAILALVLLFSLLSDSKQPDSHKYDYIQAQNDLKHVQQQRNAGLRKIDSLEHDARRRDTVEAKLKTELAIYRRDLDRSTVRAVKLAMDIKALKKDTTEHDEKCDSLATEALNYAYLYEQYKAYADSLSEVVDSNKIDNSQAKDEYKRLYNELYSKYEQLNKLYDNLYKDYGSSRKSLKREKLKTKVAALLALIAGGAAVFR